MPFASVSILLILAASVLPGSSTETRDLTFAVFPAKTTTVNLTSTAGIGDDTVTTYPNQTTATYGGTIGASIGFDPDTLVVSSFAYTGGYVQRAELAPILQIVPSISYTGIGTPLPTSFVRTSSSSSTPFYRGFTPLTLNPPASVNPVTGVVSGSHQWITNVCFERINSSRTGQVKLEIVAPPLPALQLPHRGSPSITLTQTGTSTFLRNVQATLNYQFNESAAHTIPGSAAQVIVQETGSWSTMAQFTLPTDYSIWAQANGLTHPDPDAANAAGIPWVFLYNFDLPPTTASLPITFVKLFGESLVQITLPAAGLKLPMGIEYSTTLTADSWDALPVFSYLDGANSLDAGATGAKRFFFPAAPPCFIRFTTSL